jgi:polar amino acid transport system substrate-binding protein
MKLPLMALLMGFALTAQAQAQAQKTVVINAGNIAPLSYLDQGKASGLAVEILNASAKAGKHRFEFSVKPWARAQLDTQTSTATATAIVPMSRTAERESKYIWIAELFEQHLIVVTTGTTPAPTSMAEFKNLNVGVLRGGLPEAILKAAGVKIDLANDELLNAKKLKLGRIDAWVVSEFVAPLRWREAGGKAKDLHMGMRVGDPTKIFLAGGPQFSESDAQAIRGEIEKLRTDGTIEKIVAGFRRGY